MDQAVRLNTLMICARHERFVEHIHVLIHNDRARLEPHQEPIKRIDQTYDTFKFVRHNAPHFFPDKGPKVNALSVKKWLEAKKVVHGSKDILKGDTRLPRRPLSKVIGGDV